MKTLRDRGRAPSAARHPNLVRRVLSMLASVVMVATGLTMIPLAAQADVTAAVSLEKSVNQSTLGPGDSTAYTLTVGCTSLDENCTNAVVNDLVPEPLEVTGVTVTGATASEYEATTTGEGNRNVTVAFSKEHPQTGLLGINNGDDITITISVRLPANTSPERSGEILKNTAEVTGTNFDPVDNDADVTLNIPVTAVVQLEKDWQHDVLVAGSGAANALTLSGITNASNVKATSITVTEPTGDTDPFAQMAFTGFGALTFPEGADQVQVNAWVGGTKYTGSPSASLALPDGVSDPATVTGFEIIFTSAAAGANIEPFGTPGSIVFNTVLRDAASGTVDNTASAVVETPTKTSDPATNSDSFTIGNVTYGVEAGKSFDPTAVVTGGTSTVTISGKNTSNTSLSQIVLTEPAEGTTNPFAPTSEDGKTNVAFTGFVDTPWPAGATSVVVQYSGEDPVTVTKGDEANIPWPSAPANVAGFTLTFNGSFAPNATVQAKFAVEAGEITSGTSATVDNTVGVSAPEVTDEATKSASLTVNEQIRKIGLVKTANPTTVGGQVGQAVTTSLRATVDAATNSPISDFTISDEFTSEWQYAFTPKTVAVTPGTSTVLVEYFDGTDWQTVSGGEALTGNSKVTLALPSDAQGVRAFYTAGDDQTYGAGYSTTLEIGFETKTALQDGTTFTNTGIIPGGDNDADATDDATVTVDDDLEVVVGKSWSPAVVHVTDEDPNPSSRFTVAARNGSALFVDKLELTDPGGAEAPSPFDYLDATAVFVTSENLTDAVRATATLTLTTSSGETIVKAGVAAFSPSNNGNLAVELSEAELALLPTVTGVHLEVGTAENRVAPQGRIAVAFSTELRDTVRGTDTQVQEALEAAQPNQPDGVVLIDNKVWGQVTLGDETHDREQLVPLTVVYPEEVSFTATTEKRFYPDNGTLFDASSGQPRAVRVELATEAEKPQGVIHNTAIIEDVDPTFWNAFDFTSFRSFRTGAGAATPVKAEIEFFVDGTFTADGGELTVTGGEWIEGGVIDVVSNNDLPGGTTYLPDDVTAGQVQGIRVTYYTEDGSQLPTSGGQHLVDLNVTARYELRDGSPNVAGAATGTNPGETVANTVANTVTSQVGFDENLSDSSEATEEFVFSAGTPGLEINKTVGSSGELATTRPGETVSFTLTYKNTGTTPLTNPVIVDELPVDGSGAQLYYNEGGDQTVSYSVSPETATIPTDPGVVDLDFDETDSTLTISFPEGTLLLPGETFHVSLPLTVRAGLLPVSGLENIAVGTADEDVEESDNAFVNVIQGQSYERLKLVKEAVDDVTGLTPEGLAPVSELHRRVNPESTRPAFDYGALDPAFSGYQRTPFVVETNPGGTADWLLSVRNTGNVPADVIDIVDVFPTPGDTMLTSSAISRQSEWTPIFTGNLDIDAPESAEVTVWYLTGGDTSWTVGPTPSSNLTERWDDSFSGSWSTTAPDDLAEVKGIRVRFEFPENDLLAPLDGVSVSFTTQSQEEFPEGVDELAPAWNTVAVYTHAEADAAQAARLQEPNRAGITFRKAPTYAIGDYTWVDVNRDGVQDDDEPVLPGVKVTLLDADGEPVPGVEPVFTDVDGLYIFDELPAGDYQLKFELTDEQAAIYEFTAPKAGDDPALDSNAGDGGLSDVFTLGSENTALTTDYADQEFAASEGIDPTWDAGVVLKLYAVGDYTWIDVNRDGVQDDDEPVLPGVKVTLLDADGEPVPGVEPVFTDVDGLYIFDELPAGEYRVKFELTDEQQLLYNFTAQHTGADIEIDSNANTGTGVTDVFVLGPPTDGVNTIPSEQYSDQPVKAAYIDPTIDAGVVLKTYAIGDYTWVDVNRDGVQDDDEPVLPGVKVTLLDADGEPVPGVEPVFTDVDGLYIFDELPAGDYRVKFELTEDQAAIYTFTSVTAGSDAAVDSDAGTDGTSGPIVLGPSNTALTTDYTDQEFAASEGIDPTWDAGVVTKTYAIGDYTWIDSNGDGIQNEDEDPLPGVKVTLLDADGEPVPGVEPVFTDVDGLYIFDELPAGDYQLKFELTDEQAAIYEFTAPKAGDDPALDSNAGDGGLSDVFTLGDENTALTKDYEDQDVNATEGIDPTWDAGVVLLVPGYEFNKISDPVSGTAVNPGDDITYTLSGENTGKTVLDPVMITDDLAGVLEFAELTVDAVATIEGVDDVPQPELTGTTLTWTGILQAGQKVEITYTVTLDDDAEGVIVRNYATSEATPPTPVGPPFTPPPVETWHPTPGYTFHKEADPVSGSTVTAGDSITYTLFGNNFGETALDVVITDDLSEVLAYSTLDGSSLVEAYIIEGETEILAERQPSLEGTVLSWTGALEVGQQVVITYTVTVNEGNEGEIINNVASSTATPPGLPPITPPEVTTEHPIPGYTLEKASDPASGAEVKVGSTITYTVTGTNTGATVLDPVVITDDLSKVLDNATLAGTPSAVIVDAEGTETPAAAPVVEGATLTWTGSLQVGEKVVVTYQVKVNDDAYDKTLVNVVTSAATPPGETPPITPPPGTTTHETPGKPVVPPTTPATGVNVAGVGITAAFLLIAGAGLAVFGARRRTA